MNSRQNRLSPQTELNAITEDMDLREAQSWHSMQDVATSRLNNEVLQMDSEIRRCRQLYDDNYGALKSVYKELELAKEGLALGLSRSQSYKNLQKARIAVLEKTVATIEADLQNDVEMLSKAEAKYAKWYEEKGYKIRDLVFRATDKFAEPKIMPYTRVLANSASSTAATPLSQLSASLSSMLGVVKSTVTGFLADPEVQKTLVDGITGSLLAGSVSSLGMFAQNTSTPAQLGTTQNYTNTTRLNF